MTSGESPGTGDTCTTPPCLPESSSPVVNSIVASSRWLFILAVPGTALASITQFVYGFAFTVMTVVEAFSAPHFDIESMKELMALFIEVIDLFLVATVFFLISLGCTSSSSPKHRCRAGSRYATSMISSQSSWDS